MNCQHCQPLLLDHLYGLLDGPEAESFDAHLAECPACAAARAETARVQGLIAKAAKSAFPNTRFEAPVEAPAKVGATTPAPTTALPVPVVRPAITSKRAVRAGAVLAWAVAAAVLLAIPGTVVPVLSAFNRAEGAKFQAETARRNAALLAGDVEYVKAGIQKRQSDAEFKVTAAEQNEIALLNKWVEEQKTAVQNVTARRLDINVQKPATVQPGAPNDFVVVVNDLREQWERRNARMVAEVHAVGASDAVIFTQALDSERQADKTHTVRLPAAAWTKVTPDAELFLVVAQVDEKTQARTELLDRVKLAGPVFATLLVTDKAQYQPGERLFFRSLTLDRISFRPPAREQVLRYELLKPDGRAYSGLNVSGTTDLVRVGNEGKVEPIRTADGAPVRGVGCGEFVLPPDLPDGDYQLALRELPNPGGFPAAVPGVVTRPVKIRSGESNHFRKLIGFNGRASYAPGETVDAWADLAFQDKPVPNAAFTVTAVVDGNPLERIDGANVTDANGRANFRFALPEQVQNGDVRLKVTFRTPLNTEETVARQVPVIGSRLKVEFFPESGDSLVAGVECKVYVRATTPAGTPADIRGVITDGRQVLARVQTLSDNTEMGANRGLGSFTYTPKLGTRVWLKLESPAGMSAPILTEVPVSNASVALLGGPAAMALRTGHVLPPAKSEGVVMSVLDPVTAPGEPIRVRIHSVGRARQLVVGAYTRGRLSDTKKVTVASDQPLIVKLMTSTDPRGGVVRVTAFEEIEDKNAADERTELKPVAERLVFRKPGEVLRLACTVGPTDGRGAVALGANAASAPALPMGSQAKLSITATDEKGNPAAAILWAAAVNTGAAPGLKDRLMTTHFFLAGEVKKPDDLENADFLLTDHPKAAVALDLLLGTQGWRRFAEQKPAPVDMVRVQPAAGGALPAPPPELTRLQAQNGQYAVPIVPPLLHENRILAEKFGPLYEAAVQASAQARAKRDAARAEAQDRAPIERATTAADAAKREANESAARAEVAQEPVRRFRANAWYAVAGLFALAMCCGLFAAKRPADRFPLGFSTLGSLGLAAFLLVAASWTDGGRAAAKDVSNIPAPPQATGAKAEVAFGFAPTNEPAKSMAFDAPEPRADAPTTLIAPKTATGVGPGKPLAKGGLSTFGGSVGAAKADAVGGGGAAGGFVPPVAGPGGIGKPLEPKTPPQPAALPGAPGGGPGVGVPGAGGPGGLPGLGGAPEAAFGKDGGWNPHRSGTVTLADILASQQAAMGGKRGEARDSARFAAQAADLKKAGDHATAYANDRANNLAAAMDAYFRQRGRMPKAIAAPAVAVDKLREAEQLAVGQILGAVVQPPPLVVREFAAPRPAAPVSADDSADTVLWQPVICLPTDGKVALDFHLGAAPGGYQVLVAGHTIDGRLGAVRGLIRTTPPQTVTPNVPGGSVPPAIPVAPGSPRAP